MNTIALFLVLFLFFGNESKVEQVKSKVYSFSKAKVEKTNSGEKQQLIDGESTYLENLEIQANTINPGTAPHSNQVHAYSEEIIFKKEGQLKITVNSNSKVMGPGSVALIMPGDEHGIENVGKSLATYYKIKYKSKKPFDTERGKNAGGSVLLDWESIEFQPHDKGGIRRFFDRKSAMSERIEMHATTLNPGIKSHEPHTHAPEEIVIMMEGTTKMEIGGKMVQGEAGDIYFLGSNIPHAIRNTGDKPCMYLAFQWE